MSAVQARLHTRSASRPTNLLSSSTNGDMCKNLGNVNVMNLANAVESSLNVRTS
jgi:hypothetical protein